MELDLTGMQKEDKEKKYDIYVEEYVLSYLKREADSLELSEICFFGQREKDSGKIFVYGAGREKEIAAFAEYEPLTELVCRLTQAGPVFMVRRADGSCRVAGFQVFYENNEAMQNYLIEWTSSANRCRTAEGNIGQEMPEFPAVGDNGGTKRHMPHSAISVQLCLILVVLVAIVISSADSYEKMEQLNRSAKEVFFAIENQETPEQAQTLGEQTEILVERDIEKERENEQDKIDALEAKNEKEEQEEGILERVEDKAEESDKQSLAEESDKQSPEEKETAEAEEPEADSAEEQGTESAESAQDVEEQGDEENAEALSRSITRYYEVERGDTLYTISEKIYGDISRVEKICEMNQISDPDKIRYGQKIILP